MLLHVILFLFHIYQNGECSQNLLVIRKYTTHWTDLTDSWPDRFLLLISFVLGFSSRLSAVH